VILIFKNHLVFRTRDFLLSVIWSFYFVTSINNTDMGKKNDKAKRRKKLTFEEEYDIWWRKKMDLMQAEPISPEMKRASKWRRAQTKKYLEGKIKNRVNLYDANTDFKKIIHEHWEEKYFGVPRHQHSD
jgi:hypothetical protein